MTLFANTSFQTSKSQTTPSKQPPPNSPTPPRIPGLGYILFPSPNTRPWSFQETPPKANPPEETTTSEHINKPEGQEAGSKPVETPSGVEEEEDHLDHFAQRRRELEAEEARKGEEDWVRSGGVLRDAEGSRDWTRTQAIREELKLRELERQILERWERYERRWNNLLVRLKRANGSNTAAVFKFEDIPWPIKRVEGQEEKPIRVRDLTVKRVEEFLLESLIVRGTKVTKKDRVRSSLLRWHPDKLGNLLARIQPEDIEDVGKGIGIVMDCLQRLNAQL